MNNARRRMVVQKYNNRPPFDMKNKEISTVGKNYKKSYEHVEKSFRTIMNHLDAIQGDEDLIDQPETKAFISNIQNMAKPKNDTNLKNIAPRILESFQKATPKKLPVALKNNPRKAVSKTEGKAKKMPRNTTVNNAGSNLALQTLYRNKNIDFGKNVPNHEMMRNLLQNYDEQMEVDPVMGRRSDQYSTFSLRKHSREKMDKATSTTDMPCADPPQKPSRNLQKLRISPKSKSKLSTRKQSRELISKTTTLRSSKEGPFLDNKIISSPSYICSNGEGTFVLEDECQIDKFNKSFVSSHQVEKLNKSFVNNSKTDNRFNKNFIKNVENKFNRLNTKKNNSRVQKLKSNSKVKVKNVTSKNYMGMMNTVKNKYPKMEVQKEPSTTDNYDWSDDAPEPEITTQVKFPQETRNAMELMLENARAPYYMRTPLTKFMKPKEELSIKPAISFNRMDVGNNKLTPAISFNRMDVGNTKLSYTRKTSPYTICRKLEPIPGSKESGGIGDYVGQSINSGKGIPCGRPGSRVTRKVQKSRGVR